MKNNNRMAKETKNVLSSSRTRSSGGVQEYSSVLNTDEVDIENDGLMRTNNNGGIVDDDVESTSEYNDEGDEQTVVTRNSSSRSLLSSNKNTRRIANVCITTRMLIFIVLLLCSIIMIMLLKLNIIDSEYVWAQIGRFSHNNTNDIILDDTENDNTADDTNAEVQKIEYTPRAVHYHTSNIASLTWNPYDIDIEEEFNNFILPSLPDDTSTTSVDDNDENYNDGFGYIRQPDIVNDTIVFISEGDLYWSRLNNNNNNNTTTISAIKLATTIGNILYPKMNPLFPYFIAYRATYESRSDIYLIDLRYHNNRHKNQKQKPSQRLTYFETSVNRIIGWKSDGTSILFSAESNSVSLRDERIYEITLKLNTNNNDNDINNAQYPIHVLEIRPIPLSQATEGFWTIRNNNDNDNNNIITPYTSGTSNSYDDRIASMDECFYFVRYRQHSFTLRYIGGTAESIWAYCSGESVAVHITNDYNGTNKNPQILTTSNNISYLVFMSDRTTSTDNGSDDWSVGSMNLWAMTLPNREQLYGNAIGTNPNSSLLYDPSLSIYSQLTTTSCQFNGMVLQEYTLDPISGKILLRIGADLYQMNSNDIITLLPAQKTKSTITAATYLPKRIPIHIISDFREQQERLIEADTNSHFNYGDIFHTSYGSTNTLLTLRGQVWVVPVIEDYNNYENYEYDGAGMNIPQRYYRVIPGAMTGGSIRVLKALIVPLLTSVASPEDDIFNNLDNDNNNATTGHRRLDKKMTSNVTNDTKTVYEKNTTSTPHDIGRRIALVLATDPNSPTAEHAFYLVEVQSDNINSFTNLNQLPKPFLGGNVNGGSTKINGLGTIKPDTVQISPCGRRFVWADTDNRICVMTMPIYTDTTYMESSTSTNPILVNDDENKTTDNTNSTKFQYQCLPATNEMNEPMAGTISTLQWSPGGRYLAVGHHASNQFHIITIVDCGNPIEDNQGNVVDIKLGRAVQVTSSRFNCYEMYWGISAYDIFLRDTLDLDDTSATTLYFLSDRDVISDVISPWGPRAPTPHFAKFSGHVYALPFSSIGIENNTLHKNFENEVLTGRFAGGGAMEVYGERLKKYKDDLKAQESDEDTRRRLKYASSVLSEVQKKRKLSQYETNLLIRHLTSSSDSETVKSPFPKDLDIDFGDIGDDKFSKTAYRISHIPKARYTTILTQTPSDGSLILIQDVEGSLTLKNFLYYGLEFPSDAVTPSRIDEIVLFGLSTDRKYIYLTSEMGKIRIASNTPSGISNLVADADWTQFRAHLNMALSVWPQLEYMQMYNDAWRLLRDYFYDKNMHGINWNEIHTRYKPLVGRCAKREELDDVLGQMIAELCALHAFVMGGEYNTPNPPGAFPAFLGARLRRVPEWKGYMIEEIPEPDPDFNLVDGVSVYSPLSDQTLHLSGQRGLMVGDVIVGINGESVLQGTDINMHLRGLGGYAARLEVIRLASGEQATENVTISQAIPEPLIVVPINTVKISDLMYNAWEWKTRQHAKELASTAGFTVGYAHLQAMDRDGEDAFARGFFPDYDKDGFILDVRHNGGGNIDSWIETFLQRKAWSYWAGRGVQNRTGDIDWGQQFAFRGKIVVLLDEKTASNGEGVSRGISELVLGKMIGTRSWGGGIWGSSANVLVDGGIAAAPQWGVFSDKWGWGEGVEMTGVTPDIEVDNDPYQSYHGRDAQLERAILVLKEMLIEDPVPEFSPPLSRPNMTMQVDVCQDT